MQQLTLIGLVGLFSCDKELLKLNNEKITPYFMSLAKHPFADAFLSDIRNNNVRYLIDCREREDEKPNIITIIVVYYHEKHYVICSRELRTGHFMYVV